LHYTTISKYELGKIEPNLNQLGKFAAYYGVSTDWLLGLSEENNLAV
jgi:transcriptional regulator with XRE-family HTH domain